MIIIINGGTQGLGEAVARRAISVGLASGLVLVGRSNDKGTALAKELSQLGVDSLFVAADMVDPTAPNTVVEATTERFGSIGAVVNIAAKTSRATLFSDTPEHFDAQMNLNVKAPFFLIQAAAKVMVEQGLGGSIVNVGSTSGYGGQPRLVSYCMSKGALAVMTKNLAFSLMRHRIRVNQVNPGWMQTESEHRTQIEYEGAPENWVELANQTRPLGRLVQPDEVANVIVFCLSQDSGLMTGNCIDIDQSVQGAGDPPTPSEQDTVWPT